MGKSSLRLSRKISWRSATFFLALLVAAGIFSCSRQESEKQGAGSPTISRHGETAGRLHWLGFNDALAAAAKNNKPIMIHFYADWCRYCKKFERETLENQEVVKTLEKYFVSVRLNADAAERKLQYRGRSFSSAELGRYFGITGLPSQVFLNARGQPITLIPGFIPPSQFLSILDYIQQKCYLAKITLAEFMKRGGCK